MKFLLSALLLSLPALAQAAPIVCDNGQPDNDSAFEITINPKSRSKNVVLQLWETTYEIPASAIVKNGNSIAIVGQKLTGWAEGEKGTSKVDALFVYDAKKKTMNTTLIFDGYVNRAGEALRCR